MTVVEEPIRIPGSFVVLQGLPGDGLSNTMDRLPSVDSDDLESSPQPDAPMMMAPPPAFPTLGGLFPAVGMAPVGVLQTRRMVSATTVIPSTSLASDDSFIVVSEDAQDEDTSSSAVHPSSPLLSDHEGDGAQESATATAAAIATAMQADTSTDTSTSTTLQAWRDACRQAERDERREWRESLPPRTPPVEEQLWWVDAASGQLIVLECLPQRIGQDVQLRKTASTLPPGTTVVATQLITLGSTTLVDLQIAPIPNKREQEEKRLDCVYRRGREGWLQLIHIEAPCTGYVVLSANGYAYLGPGLPSAYVDPSVWLWRVTCPVGAFVREGLDLSTRHIATLPYGSLLRVLRKTVNAMGLSRLQIEAVVEEEGSGEEFGMEGWCSEFLNPLSGQRGSIVQPLPFPVPALYRVVLPEGAYIRSGVELSSPQIGCAPEGAILTITGRAFSEHPTDHCVERLRLAGNGGWISGRLNKQPPHDLPVVEFLQTDSTFEPTRPGEYHLQAMERVSTEQHASGSEPPRLSSPGSSSRRSPDVSSIASSAEDVDDKAPRSPLNAGMYSAIACQKAHQNKHDQEHCLICLCEERSATLVHGETGHIACCLVCARILKARKDPCPVCRLPIDLVIQHFWA